MFLYFAVETIYRLYAAITGQFCSYVIPKYRRSVYGAPLFFILRFQISNRQGVASGVFMLWLRHGGLCSIRSPKYLNFNKGNSVRGDYFIIGLL